jgi:predicted glycosyltransferase
MPGKPSWPEKMRILIDIGHPAHVHLFKNLAWKLQEKGHQIFFTAREKEHETYLLKTYGFSCKSFGRHYSSRAMKVFGLFRFDFQMFIFALRSRPGLFISHGSIYASHIAWLLRKPHVSLEDTGNFEQIRLYRPFTDIIITPENLKKDLGPKQVVHNAYHEIAYLHPDYYNPSPAIYEHLNLRVGQPYAVMRFVSWHATHDAGEQGLTMGQKRRIYDFLSASLPVFVSSEAPLPDEFEKNRLDIPPERIHDVLYYASIYIGEGATMAAETGLLGTPAIYVNSQRAGNCEDLAEYGLVFPLNTTEEILDRAGKIIRNPDQQNEYRQKREKLLAAKTDLTAFLISLLENKYL